MLERIIAKAAEVWLRKLANFGNAFLQTPQTAFASGLVTVGKNACILLKRKLELHLHTPNGDVLFGVQENGKTRAAFLFRLLEIDMQFVKRIGAVGRQGIRFVVDRKNCLAEVHERNDLSGQVSKRNLLCWHTFAQMTHNTQQKFRPLLVRAVAQALQAIFHENRHADKVIEQTLKSNPKAGSHDRAFIAETTYEIVRYYRLYTEILGKTPANEADFWKIIGIHLLVSPQMNNASKPFDPAIDVTLPDWIEFKTLRPKAILEKAAELLAIRKFRTSIPDWLDTMGEMELGEQWDATIDALNHHAAVVLRVNRLKTDRNALQKIFQEDGIDARTVGESDALVLSRRQNVFITKAFKSGLFELQDYSSQLVSELLAPQPGMRVVDACAGAGGKTLHLAALMQNKGGLIALDTFGWKLDELRLRARRAGVSNIETRVIENRKVIKRLYNTADRLLLDVPCSGLGVLRRNPDAKWKLQMESIDNLRVVQQDILQAYSPIVKTGGRMVYATCSILPSENQQQVEKFLASPAGKTFKLLEEKRILPQDEGFDGFYMALLEKVKSDDAKDTNLRPEKG